MLKEYVNEYLVYDRCCWVIALDRELMSGLTTQASRVELLTKRHGKEIYDITYKALETGGDEWL